MARNTNVIEKIQLLLNKAEGNANEHEAEMCYNEAMKLMQRHAVDESMLPGNAAKESIIKVVIIVKKRDEIRTAKTRLISGIAKANRCRIINASNRGEGEVWIFGYESDVAFVEMLYMSVLLQYAVARNRGWKEYYGPESRYLWVNSFAQGYANRIGDRLVELAEKSAKEAGTELVLFDRGQEVADYIKKTEDTVQGRMVKSRNGTGFNQGWSAGGNANLSGGRNNLSGRKTLGA